MDNVTVLEQYHSYYMQRVLTDEENPVIWTPVLAPITRDWSCRNGSPMLRYSIKP